MREQDKYLAMWEFESYRAYSPGEGLVDQAIEHFTPNSSVIDFGAGTGRASQKLAKLGYRVLAVDFARNCLNPGIGVPFLVADLTALPELRADYGLCCDVMEHIPTEAVDGVLGGIHRSVGACFFSIALHQDSAGRLINEKLHMTVEPASWWRAKLTDHWVIDAKDNGTTLIAMCRNGF